MKQVQKISVAELTKMAQNMYGNMVKAVINLHPTTFGTDDFIEFDSMINIRPRQNNMSRSVEDKVIQKRLREIVAEVVHE